MIKSMTGYGQGLVKEGDVIVEAEIKTFNNRFQDIGLKVPKSILDKEFQIRNQLRKSMKRGKINLSVHLRREGTEGKALFVDKNGLDTVVGLVKEIAENAGINKNEIRVSDYLNFQSMFITDSILDEEKEFELIEKAISLAAEQVILMREKEGKELENDLRKRLEIIEHEIDEISDIKRETVETYFHRLIERASQLFAELNENPDRLNTELALLAEKYDITEECVRLNSHIKLFKDTLSNSDDIGKKLNFIVQEMNREANTINSKTISQEISHKGITIKQELEKIREQIQNIE